MSNPFDAAIKKLRNEFLVYDGLYPSLAKQYEAAIRVLEAAGRVDKEDAIDNLDGLVVCFYGMVVGEKAADIDISRYSNIRPSHGQTRALLSALPEVTK